MALFLLILNAIELSEPWTILLRNSASGLQNHVKSNSILPTFHIQIYAYFFNMLKTQVE